MPGFADKIQNHVAVGEYEQAYQIGADALAVNPTDEDVLTAMYELTAKLRSECYGLAVRKADFGEPYLSKEDLLRKANALTGEDMYGRFV
jgi:hypothetical protein